MNRSELRYACYRAKGGTIGDDVKERLDIVNAVREPHHHWDEFTKSWDIVVGRDGVVKIVKPIINYDKIHNTLLEAALYARQGVDFDSFSDEQENIVVQVQVLMLEGIMTWENYNTAWGVTVDPALKQIKTILYNLPPSQIEVTDEMIEASKKDADGSAYVGEQPINNMLEAKPMSKSESDLFEKFLASKYKK